MNNMLYVHGSANYISQYSLCFKEIVLRFSLSSFFFFLFCYVLKVSVLLERISPSYQQDALMSTPCYAYEQLPFELEELSYWFRWRTWKVQVESEAKLNLSSKEELREAPPLIRNSHICVELCSMEGWNLCFLLTALFDIWHALVMCVECVSIKTSSMSLTRLESLLDTWLIESHTLQTLLHMVTILIYPVCMPTFAN